MQEELEIPRSWSFSATGVFPNASFSLFLLQFCENLISAVGAFTKAVYWIFANSFCEILVEKISDVTV